MNEIRALLVCAPSYWSLMSSILFKISFHVIFLVFFTMIFFSGLKIRLINKRLEISPIKFCSLLLCMMVADLNAPLYVQILLRPCSQRCPTTVAHWSPRIPSSPTAIRSQQGRTHGDGGAAGCRRHSGGSGPGVPSPGEKKHRVRTGLDRDRWDTKSRFCPWMKIRKLHKWPFIWKNK